MPNTHKPLLPIQLAYLDFAAAGSTATSNKAKSYVQALNLISAALKETLKGTSGVLDMPDDIWTITDPKLVQRMYAITKAYGGKNGALYPYFAAHGQTSYLTSNFCTAALRAYAQFLSEKGYVDKALSLVSQSAANGTDLAKKLEKIPVVVDPFIPDNVGAGSYEAKDIVRAVKQRQGQAAFRRMIVSLYGGKCAVCGLNVPETLRASHIVAWADDEKNRLNPENGLCLSATYDAAFDKHLISFDEDYKMVLSKSIKDYATNGAYQTYFAAYEGQPLSMPSKFLPSQGFLAKHREQLVG